jgi:hypothetical protein
VIPCFFAVLNDLNLIPAFEAQEASDTQEEVV